jgi:hypothetical protein
MSTLPAILIALAITYTAVPIALGVLKPDDRGIAAATRVLPDTIARVSRLARNRSLPLFHLRPDPGAGQLHRLRERAGTSPERRARAMSFRRLNGPKGQEHRSVPHGHNPRNR